MNNSIALPSIEIIDIEESKFSPLFHCVIKVCYVQDEPNRNKSITKDCFKMAPSAWRSNCWLL